MSDRSQTENNRSQSQHDILINSAVQAVLITLLRELDDGADLTEMRDIVEGLLYYAQGKRNH